MILQFIDLMVGDRFKVPGVESEFIKIFDEIIKNVPLQNQPTNAIRLDNKHRVVFGYKVAVERIDEPEEVW